MGNRPLSRTIGLRRIAINLSGSAEPISSTRLLVTDFELYCSAVNAGAVYIGNSTVDNSWIPRAKGTIVNFTHGDGNMDGDGGTVTAFDLNQIYVYGTLNDDVIIQYFDYDQTSF